MDGLIHCVRPVLGRSSRIDFHYPPNLKHLDLRDRALWMRKDIWVNRMNVLPHLGGNPLPPFVGYRNKYQQLGLWASQWERLFLGVGGGFLQYSNNRPISTRFHHVREGWKSLNCSQNLQSPLYAHNRLCFWVESSVVSVAAQTNPHYNFCCIVFSLLHWCP